MNSVFISCGMLAPRYLVSYLHCDNAATTETDFPWMCQIWCLLIIPANLHFVSAVIPFSLQLNVSYLSAFTCKKGKAIPTIGTGGPWGCETSGIPYFLYNQLKDGDEVVSLTCRMQFTPQKNSCYSLVKLRAGVQLEGLGKLKKSNDFIGNRTCDLPACIKTYVGAAV
jgi:hypothetical protein